MPRAILLVVAGLYLSIPQGAVGQSVPADGRQYAGQPTPAIDNRRVTRSSPTGRDTSSHPSAHDSARALAEPPRGTRTTAIPPRGKSHPQEGAIPIPPPSSRGGPGTADDSSAPSLLGGVVTVVTSSLAIVIGLFLLLAWLSRRAMPRAAIALPQDVVEVLGKSPLAGRSYLQLIRLGNKLVLISTTPDGAEPLSEIDDPEEVNRLTGICRQHQPESISTSFRQVLDQLGRQKSDDEPVLNRQRRNVLGSRQT